MKKVIISESQLEKVRNLIYKLFDQRLYPVDGWRDIDLNIPAIEGGILGYYKGETFINTDEGHYNYYSCEYIKLMELEDTECPCLMLQDDDYYFFDKRFPADLWKPLLVNWWNEQCEYPVEAVYKF